MKVRDILDDNFDAIFNAIAKETELNLSIKKSLKEEIDGIMSWTKDFTLESKDELDLSMEKYRLTGDQKYFNDSYEIFEKFIKKIHHIYITKLLPVRVKRLNREMLGYDKDYYGDLYELAMICLKKWDPKIAKYTTYVSRVVYYVATKAIRQIEEPKYMEGFDMAKVDFAKEEAYVYQLTKNNYKYDETNELIGNEHVNAFVRTLTDYEKMYYTLLVTHRGEMSLTQVAKISQIDLGKLKRQANNLKDKWVAYNEGK